MPFSVIAIRERVGELIAGDVLADGNGWTIHSTFPGDSQLPAIVVEHPDEITYNETMRGTATGRFTVIFIVSLADSDHGQQLLDAAMSYPGVVAPLQFKGGGAGVWHSLRVVRADNVRTVAVGGSTAWAFDLTVEITA